jgi:hypothetical protein
MNRSKKFIIGKKSFIANFPNVGQIIDIDSMKQALSGGRYGVMAASGVQSAYYALDLIDAISFFSVVCPEVGKYLDISNYANLQVDEAQDILNAYTKEIRPWYNETMQELRGFKIKPTEPAEDGE